MGDDVMTCGACGHRYPDNTPAGRCPREADHVYDDPDAMSAELDTAADKLSRIDAAVSAYEAGAANAGDPDAVVSEVRAILGGA